MLITTIKKESFFIILLSAFFSVGLVFHLVPYTLKYVLYLTDITLLVSNSIVFYFVLKRQNIAPLISWSILAFIITWFIELAGVKTGQVFGDYHYGDAMLLQVYNVPLVIGMNWVILIMGSYSIVERFKLKPFLNPILSSILIVFFDYLMEDVAMKLDYWQWAGGAVPIKNYIAWFFISLIFSTFLALLKLKLESTILRAYFIIQTIFFLLLRIFIL